MYDASRFPIPCLIGVQWGGVDDECLSYMRSRSTQEYLNVSYRGFVEGFMMCLCCLLQVTSDRNPIMKTPPFTSWSFNWLLSLKGCQGVSGLWHRSQLIGYRCNIHWTWYRNPHRTGTYGFQNMIRRLWGFFWDQWRIINTPERCHPGYPIEPPKLTGYP